MKILRPCYINKDFKLFVTFLKDIQSEMFFALGAHYLIACPYKGPYAGAKPAVWSSSKYSDAFIERATSIFHKRYVLFRKSPFLNVTRVKTVNDRELHTVFLSRTNTAIAKILTDPHLIYSLQNWWGVKGTPEFFYFTDFFPS